MKREFEEDIEYIFIPDDEGNDEKFEIVYQFDHEDKHYLLVTPADTDDEEAEVFAFRFEEDEDGMELYMIEEESEWDMIEEVFNTLNDEFNQ